MKVVKLFMVFMFIIVSVGVQAGRSGLTDIESIVIKKTHIEIYTVGTGGCEGAVNRWHLLLNHPNHDALISGFIASNAASKKVDIVGRGNCTTFEEIDWAYILK